MSVPSRAPRAPSTESLRSAIEHLAGIDRASCSHGERIAADWIAGALRRAGADARVETERVHGTYWWPLGVACAAGLLGAAAANRSKRIIGAALAAAGAAAVVDDLDMHGRWLRRLLPKSTTANVVAECGDPHAQRTVIFVAHHDAAHTGTFFNPALTALVGRLFDPPRHAAPRVPPLMAPIVAAPATVALATALRMDRLARLAALACAAIIASLADIAVRPTVPGANDNLTGVATLLGLAEALRREPPRDLRVLLVSTGAEESLMEGMRAFARRHRPLLEASGTCLVCVDTVGSPNLLLAEAEGMLRLRPYDRRLTQALADSAADEGVDLWTGLRMRLGTDGFVALRLGVPAAMLTSVGQHGSSSNYHWRTDTPANVDYGRLEDAVRICERFLGRLRSDRSLA